MPYTNEHAARLIQPERFEKNSFRRKKIASGIDIIIGKLKGHDKTTAQAYRFKKSSFTADEAKKWLKDHDIKYISFESASNATQSFIGRRIQALSKNEIFDLIPESILNDIKSRDQHPYFQAYSICHEGTANPTILGSTSKPIKWFRTAVQSIKNSILKGIKFFIGHNEDNSTKNRDYVGEIIAEAQKEIDGKLHHIVIGYFPDKYRVQSMDICSMEAEWNLLEFDNYYIADTLDKITGIALGMSDTDSPAFEDAKRLAIMQAFEYDDNKSGNDLIVPETHKRKDDMDLSTIAFTELVTEIKRRNTFPSQIYSVDDIKKDKEFNNIYTELEDTKTKLKENETKLEALEKEKTGLDQKLMKSTAKDRLSKIINNPEKPLSEKQRNFITKSFEKLNIEDVSDEGLQKFADNRLLDFQITEEIDSGKNVDQKKIATQTDNSNVEENDFTKASNNELLEEDLET